MTKRDIIQQDISNRFISSGFYGIIYVAPRVGKIKITLNCLDKKDKVIIAYPEINIKKSWETDIKKWKFKGKPKYTTFMSFKKLKDPCDVLVLDEVHLLSDSQIMHISNYIRTHKIKKVIGLTGTLAEDTKFKLKLHLNLEPKVEYSIEQAIEDEIVTDYRIEVRFIPLSTVRNLKVKWKGGEFITSEKESYNYISNKISNESNSHRLKVLRLNRMGIIKKSQAKINLTKQILKELGTKRVLVFTGLIEVADSLGIDSYHSKSKIDVSQDFISGRTNKLAVVRQLNTGVTFKSIDTAIINFFDSNSENMAQKISRITCMEYNNPDKIANIIIVCSTEEQEKQWLNKALSFFEPSKIKYL